MVRHKFNQAVMRGMKLMKGIEKAQLLLALEYDRYEDDDILFIDNLVDILLYYGKDYDFLENGDVIQSAENKSYFIS